MYNLTNTQKNLLRRLVQLVREEKLGEEFYVYWVGPSEALISGYQADDGSETLSLNRGALGALEAEGLIRNEVSYQTRSFGAGSTEEETSRCCTLTGRAYEAVECDFNAPDTSFLKHLTPLADVTNFDEQLKRRCLPILGAGAADPTLWDSAVRTAGVILEERLRDVGKIADRNRVGQALVNDVFSERGTLASKFQVDSERQGYRDQFAGVVGTLRNPSAHRLLDPSPETGGAILVFINYLLKKLEELR